MLLLDTMVVSDLGKSRVAPGLKAWAERTDLARAHLSAVSVEEIELGILLKARRDPSAGEALREWFEASVLAAFAGRILPVDVAVARKAAALHVERTRPANDARLAATALVHRLALVTRNTRDFAGLGLALINPYAEPRG
jgi:predicted nucleic acid-binding protein